MNEDEPRSILGSSTSWSNGCSQDIKFDLKKAWEMAQKAMIGLNLPPPWVGKYLGTMAQFNDECEAHGVRVFRGNESLGPCLPPFYCGLTVLDCGDHVLVGDAPEVFQVRDGKRAANQTVRATVFPPEKGD